jgi:hypothetical protein
MPQPSSAAFWSLIDRWHVSTDTALELINYQGKLSAAGQRPRFRLSAEQAKTVATMLEIDSALATAGIDRAWLCQPSEKTQRSPLDLMRAGETDEVLRSLTQTTLQASLTPENRA